MGNKKKSVKIKSKRFEKLDVLLLVVLAFWGIIILLPFLNVVAISFSSQKAYADTPLLLFPKDISWNPTTCCFRMDEYGSDSEQPSSCCFLAFRLICF